MVSLLHNSSLPTVIASGNEHLQRIQATHTHVSYDGLTLGVDYVQEGHHSSSPGIPLIALGNPQDQNSATRESIGGSPSRPLHPGLDQPSQSQKRMHWLFNGHQPYIIAYATTTALLALFHLLLIGLWSHHLFERTLFNIARLGQYKPLHQTWPFNIAKLLLPSMMLWVVG
ncbi:hypothetical protein BS47DRAFT_50363 [Hydnum rufescens UP504]|uniref:Uncharacterized protein n=1 Tax=Hydnum rufescens UP504 TaxID=1448309 RepID=A0A9P6ARN8_9AGAM|nr:hypothetical protein BS47DRAFT_50363 [Hydnum rufescens UP504]